MRYRSPSEIRTATIIDFQGNLVGGFYANPDSIINLHKNNGTVWASETGNSLSVMRAHSHC